MRLIRLVLVAAFLCPASVVADDAKPDAKAEAVRVPYQLSNTKHIVVRVKINDKGPFNFIIDTGAPALFIGTETAKKAGLKAEKGVATIDKFEIEGGITIEKTKGMVDDPFQLIGMNKMNLPGIRYDGILGYTILAKYRIDIDFTQTHLGWTKIDWEPPRPAGLAELGGSAPAEFGGMGTMVQFAAALIGRRPDAEIVYRGFLGVELAEKNGGVHIQRIIPGSPAAATALKVGDKLLTFGGKDFKNLAELHKLAAEHPADKSIGLEIERAGKKIEVSVQTSKSL